MSAAVTNPIFSANTFYLPITAEEMIDEPRLQFACFTVTDRKENAADYEQKGQARLLGDCILELGPLIPSLTDIHGIGVRRALEFSRNKDGSEVTVGRFTILLKLVGEYMTQYPGLEGTNLTGPKRSSGEIHLLPPEDMNFKWRIRSDIRAAIDFPLNRTTEGGLPSCYVEIGWSLYEQTEPDEYTKIMSVLVEKNRHPHWNQQLLFNNPPEVLDLSGFLWVTLRDKNAIEPIERFNIPLEYFIPFTPVHLEVHCRNKNEEETNCKFYCSFVLERPVVSAVDSLCKVVMSWADFKPIPSNHKKFAVMLTTDSHSPSSSPYIKADLSVEQGLERAFQMQNSLQYTTFLSPWMRIPPDPMDNIYQALSAFTIPKTYLQRNTTLYLVVKDETQPTVHAMPSVFSGYTDSLDKPLLDCLYAPGNPKNFYEITYSGASADLSSCRTYLELACYPLEGVDDFDKGADIDDPRVSLNKLLSSGPAGVEDKEKWQLLSRELAQKQEIIHRMMRELDDKTQSLKLTSAEIIDLRRTVKMMQSENAILRKKLGEEEQLELQVLVSKEIQNMDSQELRNKILKLAQAYRSERIRNEEFERALKSANQDLANAKQLQTELENISHAHTKKARKLMELNKEISKINLYKDTIRKQEKVISKLEALLEKTIKDTKRAREGMLELEKLRTENLELQRNVKDASRLKGSSSEVDRLRSEVQMLETLVAELRDELKSKRPQTAGQADWEEEKIEYEVKLQKAEARVEAIQNELTMSAAEHAKEISRLKMIIAEKESIIETINGDMANGGIY